MRHILLCGSFLFALACQGEFIDDPFPGTNPPPTTNAALAFRMGGTGSELITGIVADPAGDVFVAGSFTAVADFDPGAGTTALTSLGATDVFLARYSAAGALVWVSRIGGTGTETATSLARDAAGNLFVGGGFTGATDFDPGAALQVLNSVGGEDGFIAKYTASGTLLWARRFGGSGEDQVAALSVDLAGSVYAGGSFSGQANLLPVVGPSLVSDGPARDGFVLALDAGGNPGLAFPIGGLLDDAVRGVAVATGGSILVAGTFLGSADLARNALPVRLTAQGGTDLFLASYSAAGVLQYAGGIGGLGEEAIPLGGLVSDNQNGANLLGSFAGATDFDPGAGSASRISVSAEDLFLARYDVAGGFVSVLTLGGQGSIRGLKALTDLDGSTLLAGWFSGAVDFDPGAGTEFLTSLGLSGATDAFVARYTQAGGLAWVSRFGESTTASDRGNSGTTLARDASGRILVAGRFFGAPDFDPGSSALRFVSLGEADGFLVKLTALGALALTP